MVIEDTAVMTRSSDKRQGSERVLHVVMICWNGVYVMEWCDK